MNTLKESEFAPFDIKLLKTQQPHVEEMETLSSLIRHPSASKEVALTATFYPLELSSFSVLDLKPDTNLVFYTETKKWRPWIGLMVSLSEDESSLTVQWLRKEKQNYVLHNKADGSRYLSAVSVESVMFADVLENLSGESERSGPYKLQNCVKSEIMNAYVERDQNLV